MSRALSALILILLVFIFPALLQAQQTSGTKDQTKEASKPKTEAKRVQADSVTINLPEGITKDQADAILNELRQIRQLLEKQDAQLQHVLAPSVVAPATPERVQ